MINELLRTKIAAQAQNRCGYCLARQEYMPWLLEVEHLIPRAKGGTDVEENLWLACRACNLRKGSQTHGIDPLTNDELPLFNPRKQKWFQHFQWSEDGTLIIARTACGRATVIALDLNNFIAVTVRRNWVSVGWHPPHK